ncbi:MAG: HD domain-containing protein [Muribaculaceae bacterium]|nr:HD domain-containing protein [Muribaculaceae bacterium]
MENPNVTENRQRFIDILTSTGRENMDYVIEDLDALGFFEAPASVKNHNNYPGGLVQHSLNVYDMAMSLRQAAISLRPDMEQLLPEGSVAIAALLHDVCKADIYRKVQKARKNEVGQYEKFDEYSVSYENFPVGHGEKSVIMLLRSGLDLEDEEIFAIRWHMGAWSLNPNSVEDERSYRDAHKRTPLVSLIQSADSLAAQILERDVATV